MTSIFLDMIPSAQLMALGKSKEIARSPEVNTEELREIFVANDKKALNILLPKHDFASCTDATTHNNNIGCRRCMILSGKVFQVVLDVKKV